MARASCPFWQDVLRPPEEEVARAGGEGSLAPKPGSLIDGEAGVSG